MRLEDKSFGLWRVLRMIPRETRGYYSSHVTEHIRWPENSPHVQDAKSAVTVILGFMYFHPRHFAVSSSMQWWCRSDVEHYALNNPLHFLKCLQSPKRFMYLVSFRFNHQWRKYISLFSREFQALSYTWQFNSFIL